jgi:hypothetical protein
VVVQESRILFSLRCQQVLPLLAAFLVQHSLWLVTAYASAGSLLSIMQFSHPQVCQLSIMKYPHAHVHLLSVVQNSHLQVRLLCIMQYPHSHVRLLAIMQYSGWRYACFLTCSPPSQACLLSVVHNTPSPPLPAAVLPLA